MTIEQLDFLRWIEKISQNGVPWNLGDWVFDLAICGLWILFVVLSISILLSSNLRRNLCAIVDVNDSGFQIFSTLLITLGFGWAASLVIFGKGPIGYHMYYLLGEETFFEVNESFLNYATIIGPFRW